MWSSREVNQHVTVGFTTTFCFVAVKKRIKVMLRNEGSG